MKRSIPTQTSNNLACISLSSILTPSLICNFMHRLKEKNLWFFFPHPQSSNLSLHDLGAMSSCTSTMQVQPVLKCCELGQLCNLKKLGDIGPLGSQCGHTQMALQRLRLALAQAGKPSQKQAGTCPGICMSLLCSSFHDFCLDVGQYLSLFCVFMPIHEQLRTAEELKHTALKFSDVTKNPTLHS